jgi:excisionase family DNA binding protein
MPLTLPAKLMTVEEVADILAVTPNRVRFLVREQIIKSVHLGRQIRITPGTLSAFIEGGGQALPGGWRKAKAPISVSE